MECYICGPDYRTGVDFHCAGCARSSVYLRRIEQARVLIEKESICGVVETIIGQRNAHNTASNDTNNTEHLHQVWSNETNRVELINTKVRLEANKRRAYEIKQEMNVLRTEVAKKKEEVGMRQHAISTIDQNIPGRQGKLNSETTDGILRSTNTLEILNQNSTIDKAKLCREIATLMRLRQRKRQKDGAVIDSYSISGLYLPDLRDINNLKCSELTAMLGSVAHLVRLVSFYLGVRLPAEITVPYRDYPLPTINTPLASYSGKKVDFPGSGSIPSIASSLSGSKLDSKGSFRPRPLFIGSDDREERLAHMAKRDSQAFNFFIEGISLLAWDIAWLCRSQGFTAGTNTWEDICNIGRNLYQLILAPPSNIPLSRNSSERNTKTAKSFSRNSTLPKTETNAETNGKVGQVSHSGAFVHLGYAQASANLRGWNYNKYNTIADSLRRSLLNEMTNAEWELLQEQEWDDGGEQFDEAVFVKTRNNEQGYDDARSIMTTRTQKDETVDANRVSGTSGWTKLKSRERS